MKQPEIGKLYYVKTETPSIRRERIRLTVNKEHKVPKMFLWTPEDFLIGVEPLNEWNEIYNSPLLLLELMKHRLTTTDEYLAKFLFQEKVHLTDWFKLRNFFEYFELCVP